MIKNVTGGPKALERLKSMAQDSGQSAPAGYSRSGESYGLKFHDDQGKHVGSLLFHAGDGRLAGYHVSPEGKYTPLGHYSVDTPAISRLLGAHFTPEELKGAGVRDNSGYMPRAPEAPNPSKSSFVGTTESNKPVTAAPEEPRRNDDALVDALVASAPMWLSHME